MWVWDLGQRFRADSTRVVALLSTAYLTGIGASPSLAGAPGEETNLMVVAVAGEAEWRAREEFSFASLGPGQALRRGDSVRTWNASSANLATADGDELWLRGLSRIGTRALDAATQREAAHVSTTSQASSRGCAEHFVADTSTANAPFDLIVSEGVLVARLRGSLSVSVPEARLRAFGSAAAFRVKVEPGGAARVEVLSGRVHLAAKGACVAVEARSGAFVHPESDLTIQRSALPSPPALLHPVEAGRQGQRLDVVFSWEAVEGAQAYRLELSDSEHFDRVRMARIVAWSSTVRIAADEIPRHAVYFRVTTIHDDGFEGVPSSPSRMPLSVALTNSTGKPHAAMR